MTAIALQNYYPFQMETKLFIYPRNPKIVISLTCRRTVAGYGVHGLELEASPEALSRPFGVRHELYIEVWSSGQDL